MLKQRLLMAASLSAGPTPPGLGSLYAFGTNVAGATAQNTASGTTLAPTAAVDSNANWLQISSGWDASGGLGGTSVGLLSSGQIWSWGNNSAGGPGGAIAQGNNSSPYYVPTRVGTDSNWVYIAQGGYGGFAIKTNGALYSWGYNSDGQLGHALSSVTYIPTQVGTDTDWSKAFSGYQNSFLIKTNGTLWALGLNSNYNTGLGINTGNTVSPTQVGSDTNWLMVACAVTGGVGIRTNGTAWSWGTDANGELCQGSVGGTYTTPTMIGADTDWVFVASGNPVVHGLTFLIKSNGTLWVAGSNNSYASGRGTNSGNTTSLTQVGTDTDWAEVYVNKHPSDITNAVVALKSNGELWSWGNNNLARTGQGTTSGTTNNPTQIGTDTDWAKLPQGSCGTITILIKS